MNKLYYLIASFILIQVSILPQAKCQVLTARSVSIIPNCEGFYEYLPQNYSQQNQYPLLIYIHDQEKFGNGASDLPLLLLDAIPELINEGRFPVSFTVNNTDFSFIVISPQFKAWATIQDMYAVIKYLKQNYPVDLSRVYLTGASMGGGVTWDFAGSVDFNALKLAAIVPVAGASQPNEQKANVIATANLPVWATHNEGDSVVSADLTRKYIELINNATPPPSIAAKATIFNVRGHDAWTQTYNPDWRTNGLNVYEWMLQYQRSSLLPVSLSNYKAYASGSSSVTITWTTLNEINNHHFLVERSPNGINFTIFDTVAAVNKASGFTYTSIDKTPLDGNNFYRLVQVDVDGKITYYKTLQLNIIFPRVQSFRISPNPATNTINVEWSVTETGSVQLLLLDWQGKMLRQWNYQKNEKQWQQQLNIENIAAGRYLLKLKCDKNTAIQQFIKK